MKIGILGGGQLSRMLALAGIPMGLDFCFFEPQNPCCAAVLGKVIYAEYDDKEQLSDFVNQVDLITFENENIPVKTLNFIAERCSVYPGAKALQYSQDRLLEKQLFEALDIPTVNYLQVNTKKELENALDKVDYPSILKKRRGGYDGKSQIRLLQSENLKNLTEETCSNSILEGFVSFDREVSIIAGRNKDGEFCFYDLSENVHHQGILRRSLNRQQDALFALARDYIGRIMNYLDYVGIMALEFFQKGNMLLANEIAPRVHNSGHWTIEGAMTSQFENHLSCILGLPPGRTDSLAYTTMYNIIGTFSDKEKVLKNNQLHLHDYQKKPRTGRKLGHVTLLSQQRHAFFPDFEDNLRVD